MVLLDIKKPEKCIDCPCRYISEGAWSNYCQITETDFEGRESFGVLENCPLKEIKAEDVETVADALTKIVNQIDFNEIGKVVVKAMNGIAESLKENHLEVKDVTGRSNQGMQED